MDRETKAIVATYVLLIFLWLAFWGAIALTTFHFVRKFW